MTPLERFQLIQGLHFKKKEHRKIWQFHAKKVKELSYKIIELIEDTDGKQKD